MVQAAETLKVTERLSSKMVAVFVEKEVVQMVNSFLASLVVSSLSSANSVSSEESKP